MDPAALHQRLRRAMDFVTNDDVVRWHDTLLAVINHHRPRKQLCVACETAYPCLDAQLIAVQLGVLKPADL